MSILNVDMMCHVTYFKRKRKKFCCVNDSQFYVCVSSVGDSVDEVPTLVSRVVVLPVCVVARPIVQYS